MDGNICWLVRGNVPLAAIPAFPVRAGNDHWAALFALQSAIAELRFAKMVFVHSRILGVHGLDCHCHF